MQSSDSYRILPATYDDYIELIKMFKMSHEESQYASVDNFDENIVIERLNDVMENLDANFIVKCVLGQEMIGYFIGRISSMEFSSTLRGLERSFWVKPESRGTRAASMLIDSFLEWLRARDIKRAICTSFHKPDEQSARKFYDKKGFSEIGQIYERKV